jgi:ribosomal protein S18 acetylase RimI-like enzyme
MPEGFRVRQYAPADADAVWSLHNNALNDAGAHAGEGPWDDDLHRIEEAYLDAGGEFLVGELAGRIVAMGALLRSDDLRAEIKRMRVTPNAQRRGYGRTLLDLLERRARELGYSALHLDTTTKQHAAQELYRQHGFQEVGRGAHGDFELILFEKRLV